MKNSKILGCLIAGFVFSLANAIASIDLPNQRHVEQVGRQLFQAQMEAQQKTFADWVWKEIEAYDLTKEARKAFDSLGDDDAFAKFLEKRGVDMEQPRPTNAMALTFEYLGSTTNFRPAIVSWLTLVLRSELSWEDSYPHYLKVQKERPDDFLPRFVASMRKVKAREAAKERFTLFQEAYRKAPTTKQRTACLLLVPSHAAGLAVIPGGEEPLRELAKWLDDLGKQESKAGAPEFKEMNFIKYFVAFAQKDYVGAAQLARDSRIRAMEPLLLLIGGKLAESRTALDRLNKDEKLTPDDRRLLGTTAEILKEVDEIQEKQGLKTN